MNDIARDLVHTEPQTEQLLARLCALLEAGNQDSFRFLQVSTFKQAMP
jgi:hypothetical protein